MRGACRILAPTLKLAALLAAAVARGATRVCGRMGAALGGIITRGLYASVVWNVFVDDVEVEGKAAGAVPALPLAAPPSAARFFSPAEICAYSTSCPIPKRMPITLGMKIGASKMYMPKVNQRELPMNVMSNGANGIFATLLSLSTVPSAASGL